MHDSMHFKTQISPLAVAIPLVGLLLLVLPVHAQETGEAGTYSYFATVEGSATLFQADTDERTQVEVNLPILTGERLWVSDGSRLTVELSDGNRLRIDDETELIFERLAYSADAAEPDDAAEAEEEQTQINLLAGRLLLTVTTEAAAEPLRIDTANATIYLDEAGTYLIEANRDQWTRVIARRGGAEVLTRRGSSRVIGGEEVEIEGETWPQVSHGRAPGELELERWAYRDDEILAGELEEEFLEEPLRSRAGGLREHGEWVYADGKRAWRPYVEVGWRPYWRGRWAPTPSGLYWVSYDPWSPVTFHYGSWYHDLRYGWVWYPGYHYAPAHVYWYWGPTYTAWIPTGYYHHYYGRHRPGFGFSFGYGHRYSTYGFIGGSWGHYRYWTFCPTVYVADHRQHHHHQEHDRARRAIARPEVPRGILTTDTRGLTRDHLRQPDRVRRVLNPEARGGGGQVASLPDVTPFVARETELPPTVRQQFAIPASDAGQPSRVVRPGGGPVTAGDGRPPTRVVAPRPSSDSSRPTAVVSAPEGTRGATQRRPLVTPSRPEVRTDGSRPARRVLEPIRQRPNRTGATERRPTFRAPSPASPEPRPSATAAPPSRTETVRPSRPQSPVVSRPAPARRPTSEIKAGDRTPTRTIRPPVTRPTPTERPGVTARPAVRSQPRPTVKSRPVERRPTATVRRPVERSRSSVGRSRSSSRPRPGAVRSTSPRSSSSTRSGSVERSRRPAPVQRVRPAPAPRTRPSSSRPSAVKRSRPSSVSRSRPSVAPRSRATPAPRARPSTRPSGSRPAVRSRPSPSSRAGGASKSTGARTARAERRPPR